MKNAETKDYFVGYIVPAVDTAYEEGCAMLERELGIPSLARSMCAHITVKHRLVLTDVACRAFEQKLFRAAEGAITPVTGRIGPTLSVFEESGTIYLPVEEIRPSVQRVLGLCAEWGYPISGFEGQRPHITFATRVDTKLLARALDRLRSLNLPYMRPLELDSLALFVREQRVSGPMWRIKTLFTLSDALA